MAVSRRKVLLVRNCSCVLVWRYFQSSAVPVVPLRMKRTVKDRCYLGHDVLLKARRVWLRPCCTAVRRRAWISAVSRRPGSLPEASAQYLKSRRIVWGKRRYNLCRHCFPEDSLTYSAKHHGRETFGFCWRQSQPLLDNRTEPRPALREFFAS